MDSELKCLLCGYTIKAGHLFIPVVRAADEFGTEAPIEDGQRLAIHAGACPPVGIDDL